MTLTPLDWSIIAVYLIGCMTAGIWMRRYVRDVEDFAVAGRELDLNLGIASLAATEMGLVTVMYTAQMGFSHGFAGAIPGVCYCLAMFFVGCTGFVIFPLRKAGVITIPELFEKRFGKLLAICQVKNPDILGDKPDFNIDIGARPVDHSCTHQHEIYSFRA